MRILAVFAHPDDELGCVGTLKKHAERGDTIHLLWTTHGELASQFTHNDDIEIRRVRQEHGQHVATILGGSCSFFNMGDSRMTGSREEALELARLYATFKPDAVITWSDDHPHPDHQMSAKIAYNAITLARIPKILNENSDIAYEAHRQTLRLYQYTSSASNAPITHVDISEQIDTATELFAFYQSFYGWQYSPEQFRASRELTGREAGVKYAEKFQLKQTYLPAAAYLR